MTVVYKLKETTTAQLHIIDINGKILQQYMQGANDTPTIRMDVSELASGFYFVRLVAGETMITKKFVKN